MTDRDFTASRRSILGAATATAVMAGGTAALGAPSSADMNLTPAQRLETYIRLRSDTSGRTTFGWLDAVRSTMIDGEITPFCRMLAASVNQARRLTPELYELKTFEICFYLDVDTGALLGKFVMPGGREQVQVPIYRGGPAAVRFSPLLDEWEVSDGAAGGASSGMAPKGRVHMQRSIGDLRQFGQEGYIRADEFGRVYVGEGAPPSVFYREWTIWSAPMAAIRSAATSIPSHLSYNAASSWRPWMKMGAVKGNTLENGFGQRAQTPADFPEPLKALLRIHQKNILDNPESVLG